MIRINLTPPNTTEWNEWRQKCDREQPLLNTAVENWLAKWAQTPQPHDEKIKQQEKPEIKEDVYRGLKESFYMAVSGPFHGKCAYCESKFFVVAPGDVEHYRPKKAVRTLDGKVVMVTIHNQQVEHPGYYWLAYDWRNLMAACDLCNRSTHFRTGGIKIGKHDFFPMEGGFYAAEPGQEANENPLLLNPLFDDPDAHLQLNPQTGVLAAKTPRGQTCIEMLGLNLRDLPNERKNTFDETSHRISKLLQRLSDDPNGQATKDLLQELLNIQAGHRPYTMAARLAIKQTLGPVLDALRTLGL